MLSLVVRVEELERDGVHRQCVRSGTGRAAQSSASGQAAIVHFAIDFVGDIAGQVKENNRVLRARIECGKTRN